MLRLWVLQQARQHRVEQANNFLLHSISSRLVHVLILHPRKGEGEKHAKPIRKKPSSGIQYTLTKTHVLSIGLNSCVASCTALQKAPSIHVHRHF